MERTAHPQHWPILQQQSQCKRCHPKGLFRIQQTVCLETSVPSSRKSSCSAEHRSLDTTARQPACILWKTWQPIECGRTFESDFLPTYETNIHFFKHIHSNEFIWWIKFSKLNARFRVNTLMFLLKDPSFCFWEGPKTVVKIRSRYCLTVISWDHSTRHAFICLLLKCCIEFMFSDICVCYHYSILWFNLSNYK